MVASCDTCAGNAYCLCWLINLAMMAVCALTGWQCSLHELEDLLSGYAGCICWFSMKVIMAVYVGYAVYAVCTSWIYWLW
jgi:hypothetical protein